MTIAALLAFIVSIGTACVSNGGHHADRDQPPADLPAAPPTEQPRLSRPELWMHGLGNPARLSAVSAHGLRMILNVRKDLRVEGMRRYIAQYEARGLGLIITIRWTDPNDNKRPIRLDVAPTPAEERDAIDTLITVLNGPESRRMSGRLWVQFFNEVVGGPGTIMPEHADGLYGFATRASERIRAEAPHVKIIGPALTALDPLEAAPEPGSTTELRREGLLRALRWTITHADAVDIHLHCAGGDDARQKLAQLKRALQSEGKPDLPIVSLEWSPARFAARRADLVGAQAALADIYRAMAEAGVRIAAYAAFADTPLKDTYEWANLWDAQGRPHEPFYSLYKTLAETGEPPAQFDESAPVETEPAEADQPRRRRNRPGG